jgi:antitoxin CptB
MPSLQESDVSLDARQRRILFRSWHRGMREMDLVLGRFADAEIANLDSDLQKYLVLSDLQALFYPGRIDTISLLLHSDILY